MQDHNLRGDELLKVVEEYLELNTFLGEAGLMVCYLLGCLSWVEFKRGYFIIYEELPRHAVKRCYDKAALYRLISSGEDVTTESVFKKLLDFMEKNITNGADWANIAKGNADHSAAFRVDSRKLYEELISKDGLPSIVRGKLKDPKKMFSMYLCEILAPRLFGEYTTKILGIPCMKLKNVFTSLRKRLWKGEIKLDILLDILNLCGIGS
jgi:hypothetical protein